MNCVLVMFHLLFFNLLSLITSCSSVGVGGDGLQGGGAGNAERASSQPVGRPGGWERLRAPGLSARRTVPGPEQPHQGNELCLEYGSAGNAEVYGILKCRGY